MRLLGNMVLIEPTEHAPITEEDGFVVGFEPPLPGNGLRQGKILNIGGYVHGLDIGWRVLYRCNPAEQVTYHCPISKAELHVVGMCNVVAVVGEEA